MQGARAKTADDDVLRNSSARGTHQSCNLLFDLRRLDGLCIVGRNEAHLAQHHGERAIISNALTRALDQARFAPTK